MLTILIVTHRHDRKMWARFSAQIWLEVNDFEYGARVSRCWPVNLHFIR
jgi:hypothetical protein